MIRFHVRSANHQLRQTYFAFAAALVLNRTLVMPRVSSSYPSPITFACKLQSGTTVGPLRCSSSNLRTGTSCAFAIWQLC